jgi:hypothetical protein
MLSGRTFRFPFFGNNKGNERLKEESYPVGQLGSDCLSESLSKVCSWHRFHFAASWEGPVSTPQAGLCLMPVSGRRKDDWVPQHHQRDAFLALVLIYPPHLFPSPSSHMSRRPVVSVLDCGGNPRKQWRPISARKRETKGMHLGLRISRHPLGPD